MSKKKKNKNKHPQNPAVKKVENIASTEEFSSTYADSYEENYDYTQTFAPTEPAPEKKKKGDESVPEVEWPSKNKAKYYTVPLSLHGQSFHIVKRAKTETSDRSVIHTYLAYKKAYESRHKDWDKLLGYESDEEIGDIPKIALQSAWEIAKRGDLCGKPNAEARYGMTAEEWQSAVKIIERYVKQKKINKDHKDGPVLIQDLFKIPELDYQFLFINKSKEVFDVVREAILTDIRETGSALKQWKKIKKYRYKVALGENEGGIFSPSDEQKLREHGISSLNDLASHSVHSLKSLMLDYSFGNIVKDINAAFKEDRQRRRDAANQKYPFIVSTIILAALTALGYYCQYTLIKLEWASMTVNIVTMLWFATVLFIIWAGIRARLRRKKRPDYVFLVPKVKRRIKFSATFAVFVFCSLIFFFQRYDGYDDTYYYRDIEGGNIAIAGLVDKTVTSLDIPAEIDEKTVTKIDLFAFDGTEIQSASIPTSVEKIAIAAFSNCNALSKVTLKGSDSDLTIGTAAFRGCINLSECALIEAAEVIRSRAFESCSSLTSAYLASVETLERNAFNNCQSISTLTLNDNIVAIPKSAFKNCTRLASVVGLEDVQIIENSAFEGCETLAEVELDSIVQIGRRSFYGCKKLTSLYIPDTLESIGRNAFSECSEISEITVPFIGKTLEHSKYYSLTYYFGSVAYDSGISLTITAMPEIVKKNLSGCNGVSYVTLSEGVEKIGDKAFKDLPIKSISATAVTEIGKSAFSGCRTLSSVSGMDNVLAVGDKAFLGCNQLTSVSLPSAKTIGASAFSGCSSFVEFVASDNLEVLGKGVFEDCSQLAAVDLSLSNITEIGSNLFKDCYKITSVSLPEKLTRIPDGLFEGCSGLLNYTFGENVTEIGKNAFKSSGISTVDFRNVTKIGASAFEDCDNLKDVYISSGVTEMGKNAFADCSALVNVSIPFIGADPETPKSWNYAFRGSNVESLTVTAMTSIPKTCFRGAEGLRIVVFEGELLTVENGAFKNLANVQTIVLPNTVTSIGTGAFKNCPALQSVTLSDSLTAIPKDAFANCFSLDSVTIPDGVVTIGTRAFDGCSSLSSLVIPDSVKIIDTAAFRYCSDIETLTLGNGVELIGNQAFCYCSSLSDITFGKGLREIGYKAFASTAIETLELPEGLTKLGIFAFEGCSYLEAAILPNSLETIGYLPFKSCYSLKGISLPFIGYSRDWLFRMGYITDAYAIEQLIITDTDKIAKKTFKDMYYLEVVWINCDFTEIGKGAFDGCDSLSAIVASEETYEANKDVFGEIAVYASPDASESFQEKEEREAKEREEAENNGATNEDS